MLGIVATSLAADKALGLKKPGLALEALAEVGRGAREPAHELCGLVAARFKSRLNLARIFCKAFIKTERLAPGPGILHAARRILIQGRNAGLDGLHFQNGKIGDAEVDVIHFSLGRSLDERTYDLWRQHEASHRPAGHRRSFERGLLLQPLARLNIQKLRGKILMRQKERMLHRGLFGMRSGQRLLEDKRRVGALRIAALEHHVDHSAGFHAARRRRVIG